MAEAYARSVRRGAEASPANVVDDDDDSDVVPEGFCGVLRDVRYHLTELTREAVASEYKTVRGHSAFPAPGVGGSWARGLPPSVPLPALRPEEGGWHTAASIKEWHMSGAATLQATQVDPVADTQVLTLFTEVAKRERKRKGQASAGRAPSLFGFQAGSLRVVRATRDVLPTMPPAVANLGGCEKGAGAALRFSLIQLVNRKLADVLPLLDLSQAGNDWSLAHRLSRLSAMIFVEVKTRALQAILRDTSTGGCAYIRVNRPKATRAAAKGETDGRKSVFGQVFLQLNFVRPAALRTERRPWQVVYEGEGGQDAGGLFRYSVSHLCEDLQSAHVPLFVPVSRSGPNAQVFAPSEAAKSSLHLSMFCFVGKLMGMAIRGGHILNLDLHPLVWKPLVGEAASLADVVAYDTAVGGVMSAITQVTEDQKDYFEDVVDSRFTMPVAGGGSELELKEGGKNATVTWNNKDEYLRLARKHRESEFATQMAAVRRGLGTLVPVQLLPLFTWQELEMMVCGSKEVNIDYLKANTRFRSPVRKDSAHVKMLWRVLNDFTTTERQMFLRFVWGQSRLPYNSADFTQKFEIMATAGSHSRAQTQKMVDMELPTSHTCFFSLELPKYSTEQIMAEKLRYAIQHCQSIDTDFEAQDGQQAWDEEE